MARPHLLVAALFVGSLSVLGPVVATDAVGIDLREPAAAQAVARRAPRQSARLQMHPQISQPGTTPASAASAWSAMTATVKPRKSGRPVVLQRKQGRRWITVARKRQGATPLEFAAPYLEGKAIYRVAALRYRGLRPVASKGVSTLERGPADFTQDFNDSSVPASLPAEWSHRAQGYAPGSKRTCSKGDPSQVAMSGRTVDLSVAMDSTRAGETCDDPATSEREQHRYRLNGHIGTEGAASFRYGYAAARIKFQREQGQHGAFWLMPESETPLAGRAADHGAEIDVIEWFGHTRKANGLNSFIHHRPRAGGPLVKVGGRLGDTRRFGKDWDSRYHVFSVEWTPRAYVFRIDGKETRRITEGVSAQEQYLILSLLSSDYELASPGSGRLPQTMSVDWVRYWED